jgi:hypothetical protein
MESAHIIVGVGKFRIYSRKTGGNSGRISMWNLEVEFLLQ